MSKPKDTKQKSLTSFFGKAAPKSAATQSKSTQQSNKTAVKTPASKKIDVTFVSDSPAQTSTFGSGSSIRGTSPPTSDAIDVDMEIAEEDASKEKETRPVSTFPSFIFMLAGTNS